MKRLLLLPVLLLLLSGPASAAAKSMPAPRDNEIVVPFSIAGVKPGMKPSAALQAWGDPGKECSGGASEKFSTCQWGNPYGTTGMATFGSGVTGKVDAISLYSRSVTDGTTFPYTGSAVAALKRIKTKEPKGKEGFGLGSLLKAVIKAYPGGEKSGGGKVPHMSYAITKGSSQMTFIAGTKSGKIGQINLGRASG